ncbi:MAG: type III-B CRISPR-associated protein Cas10/Cmr2, partial [Cyanobacteriota bacterium]|nr:type III-B CRISPR-associated protein Cas10/Cmr2 [Cyanobacteriota bacterium]
MSAYWQAKIWGLLHDPALKALHNNTGRGDEGVWRSLTCMEGWVSPKAKSLKDSSYCSKWLKRIGLCDLIASASDRAAIGRLKTSIDYDEDGIEIRHLLSGESQKFRLGQWHESLMNLGEGRADWLSNVENAVIPDSIRECTDAKKVFWWFWRCYPVALTQALCRDENLPEEPGLGLLPADTRIPDASLWSHTSMTSALAGSLAGYHQDNTAYPKKNARKNRDYFESRPHVGIFTFTPVQELIKASRKTRDFWAGSWLLHYLSAKICWAIACKYGPDSLLYPCLYEQPLIDLWLLETYKECPAFSDFIPKPKERKLLTAGFPNVLVFILPDNGANSHPEVKKNPVQAAMQQAKQSLVEAWQKLGEDVLNDLQNGNQTWMPNLNSSTWDDWLTSQWQVYWTALPMGNLEAELDQSPRKPDEYDDWQKKQNDFVQPQEDLLLSQEAKFVKATYEIAVKEDSQSRHSRSQSYKARQPNLNVGSWWADIFNQTRLALNAVKNNRNWKLPTAFGPRSTISGIGPVVHPINGEHPEKDWTTEGETEKYWKNHYGLFDGIEELNATEVLKRGLHRILPEILGRKRTDLDLYYPDLCSGVAGWLRHHPEAVDYYLEACQRVRSCFEWTEETENIAWGIPWVATDHPEWPNPRLLNAGWLVDDFEPQPDDSNLPLTKQKRKEKIAEEKKKL